MTLNRECIDYLKDIKVSEVVDKRISLLVFQFEPILPEPIEDIFVEYYYKTKDDYAYPSLQLFSKNYLYQIENFLANDKLDIYPIFGIDYISLSPENYDFFNAKIDSKLVVEFSVAYVMQSTLVAIGKNCDQLKKIVNKYVKPRFITNKYFKE